MRARNKIFFLILTSLVLFEVSANAYIGPGIALGTVLVSIILVLVLIFLVIAILYYPIKRLITKYKQKK